MYFAAVVISCVCGLLVASAAASPARGAAVINCTSRETVIESFMQIAVLTPQFDVVAFYAALLGTSASTVLKLGVALASVIRSREAQEDGIVVECIANTTGSSLGLYCVTGDCVVLTAECLRLLAACGRSWYATAGICRLFWTDNRASLKSDIHYALLLSKATRYKDSYVVAEVGRLQFKSVARDHHVKVLGDDPPPQHIKEVGSALSSDYFEDGMQNVSLL